MENQKVKPVTEGGVLSALAVLMALISIYVPVIGAAVVFILPLPVIILVVRHGVKWGILLSAVSAALIAILVHPMQALKIFVAFGLVGMVFGYTYRKGYSALKSLLIGIFSSILSILAVIALSILLLNVNPLHMQEAIAGSFETSMGIYRAAGMDGRQIAQVEKELKEAVEMIGLLTPMIVVFSGIAIAYINFIVAGKVLKKLGHTDIVSLKPFVQWRMPLWAVYLYAFALIGMYWGSTRGLDLLFQASLNANILSTLLGFIQGMTLVAGLMGRYHLSKPIRWLILIIIMTNGFFLQMIGFVGLFDIVVDYRRRLGWKK